MRSGRKWRNERLSHEEWRNWSRNHEEWEEEQVWRRRNGTGNHEEMDGMEK